MGKVQIKVVPNSSRNQIVGRLGTAIKIKVKPPAESGKANAAVIAVIAQQLGIPERDILIVSGMSQPLKCVEVIGLSDTEASAWLLDE